MSKTPPTLDDVVQFDLTGYLMPWLEDEPATLAMPGTNDQALPVFSSAERLRSFMARAQVPFITMMQITDPTGFLACLPLYLWDDGPRVDVIVDPHWTAQGRVRFAEIVRDH